ncbi:Crp/Fnr family transcriptional regulator [Phenylobacterium sp.]|jgi:CRP-like cAMP-binding protein|uniref:Crp/Fnr family transcriptional regulator n=1 Tax=Phenylobacterium sp. TaxID=1871053 RepID=UPI002E370036|nr:Crp/Fnr family transcriptional regulator [Phenylobacterium sp.]HEX4711915.1 Crp/Fnr family transcriptional regulator [Phenylobacterium sp.]
MYYRNFLLRALAADDNACLAPHLREVSLSRAQPLYEPGDGVDTLFFASNACISVVSVMHDGRIVETTTVGRESAPGLLDAVTDLPATSRMFVQVAGGALALPSAVYRKRLAESPGLVSLTLRHARALSQQAELGVSCNLAHSADGRLARWLLMTQDRVGSNLLPLTQDYLAVMTGVQRTTVSLMAAALKKAKIIAYSRGQLTILDRPGLIERACECYTLSEQQFENLRETTG